jgi:hypothetical protein
MAPEKITIADHYNGDTWVGMAIGPILINSLQPPNTLASCKLEFRDEDDTLGYKLTTTPGAGEGTITISDATTWVVSIPEQLIPGVDAGDVTAGMKNKKIWYWDFETIDSTGKKLTLYKGTLKVYEDVTV